MSILNTPLNFNVTIKVIDAKDRLIRTIRSHNLLTNTGRNKMRDLIAYPDQTGDGYSPQYIALGTDDTAPAAGDTELGTEVFRKAIMARIPDDYSVSLYTDILTTEANGNLITEVGLFTTGSGGTLWCRATHTAINKTSSIRLIYQWEIGVAAA